LIVTTSKKHAKSGSLTKITADSGGKQITVVFRLDDCSAISNTRLERTLLGLLRKYGWSCTFGIVPLVADGNWFNPDIMYNTVSLGREKIRLLQENIAAGTIEPALHGLTHQSEGVYDGVHHAEFAGISYKQQYKKLEKGKQILEASLGTSIDIFIPPWNSYDTNTIKALHELDFTCLSSGKRFGGASVSRSLHYLPATCHLDNLKEAISEARTDNDQKPIIVVLLHEYDFLEVGDHRGIVTLKEFEALLDSIDQQQDVCVRSIQALIQSPEATGRKRFLANHGIYKHRRFMLNFFQSVYPDTRYLSTQSADRQKYRIYLLLIATYLIMFLMGGLLSYLTINTVNIYLNVMPTFFQYSILALLLICTVYVFRNLKIYRRGAVTLTILLGAFTGTWFTKM
jgi:peptidoglycan/xylan/chitin deacetylase (PgdA/CDA1 family)